MKIEFNEDTPIIIVMTGLPGSGKSTWRDLFLKDYKRDYVIVSSDDEIERMAAEVGLNYTDGFEQFVGPASRICKEKFREAVNNSVDIIWDQTNLTPKKRRSILSQLKKGYESYSVVFEITTSELEKRLAKRERETGKHIPPKVIKDMANTYIPPSTAEGFKKVTFIK